MPGRVPLCVCPETAATGGRPGATAPRVGGPRARRGLRPRGAGDRDATVAGSAPGPGSGTREPEGAAGGDDGGIAREATALVARGWAAWAVPLAHTVGVEHALAIDAEGRRVAWDAPDAFLRGRLDLVAVEGRQATVYDWKSSWLTEDDEGLRRAWAPGCYAALLWAWAPRLEAVTVEYHYLRTDRVARTTFTRADAIETVAWARTMAAVIAEALARPDDPSPSPPGPRPPAPRAPG